MSRSAEELKAEIVQLPREELRALRAWYENVDADEWDRQMEKDVVDAKLDDLAETAPSGHASGRSGRP